MNNADKCKNCNAGFIPDFHTSLLYCQRCSKLQKFNKLKEPELKKKLEEIIDYFKDMKDE